MNIVKLLKNDYYLNSSISYFKSNFDKRLKFIQKKNFLFNEISNFINNCIDNSKSIFIFCAGNSLISKNIKSNKIFIKEIDQKYEIKYNPNVHYTSETQHENISKCDTILIADIEHQSNPTSNLLNLSKIIKDDAKIIILSKNLIWMIFIKILKLFFNFLPLKNNFLTSSYLNNFYLICYLGVLRS